MSKRFRSSFAAPSGFVAVAPHLKDSRGSAVVPPARESRSTATSRPFDVGSREHLQAA